MLYKASGSYKEYWEDTQRYLSKTTHRFYSGPQIHKPNIPHRPIVSSIGSITYHSAKYVAQLLSPLVDRSLLHIKNSAQFFKTLRNGKIGEDEILIWYDVSVRCVYKCTCSQDLSDHPIKRLEDDTTLTERSKLSPTLRGQSQLFLACVLWSVLSDYHQVHMAAMGPPVTPVMCSCTYGGHRDQSSQHCTISPWVVVLLYQPLSHQNWEGVCWRVYQAPPQHRQGYTVHVCPS